MQSNDVCKNFLTREELLLNEAEAKNTQAPILQFWESPNYFIVLGRSNKAEIECKLETCKRDNIPILKRSSGGGTVLQGAGCLNYTLILPIKEPNTNDITKTNHFVMNTIKTALLDHLPNIEVQGHTDLTYQGKKFSGNAQRRLKTHLLFHGTFLHNFDLQKIETYLAMPSKQPDYRKSKPHLEFITNLPLSPQTIQGSLTASRFK